MARTVRDVPVMTTVILLLVMVVGVIANTLIPDRIFEIVASLATFATIFVWLMILLAHLASRRAMTPEEVAALEYKTPIFPFGQYFAIFFILFTFGIMVWLPEFRGAFFVGLAFSVLCVALYYLTGRHKLPEEPVGTEELAAAPRVD